MSVRGPSARGADDDRLGLEAGLIEDVVSMTRQAAIDGLPLEAVYADLRLVLDLDESAEIPTGLLRACATAWSRTQRQLDSDAEPDQHLGTAAELMQDLWARLASLDRAERPVGAITMTAPIATASPRASGVADSRDLVDRVDLMHIARRLLSSMLDLPGEYVALVREPEAVGDNSGARAEGWRLVGLVSGDAARLNEAYRRLCLLDSGRYDVVVEVHTLGLNPSGHAAEIEALFH